jgi:adenosyl cobinamide kinase/adenosyl cobinamide phosphate guanylyltransferase
VITLVLGGTRSGKSALGERLAATLPQPVTYLATASAAEPGMAVRIERHRQRRPKSWATIEAGPRLVDVLATVRGTVLIDSLGTWVASSHDLDPDADGLCDALREHDGDVVIVSEEVGLGVHAATEVGRAFADALGELNQAVAAVADDVLLAVAGRALTLPAAP